MTKDLSHLLKEHEEVRRFNNKFIKIEPVRHRLPRTLHPYTLDEICYGIDKLNRGATLADLSHMTDRDQLFVGLKFFGDAYFNIKSPEGEEHPLNRAIHPAEGLRPIVNYASTRDLYRDFGEVLPFNEQGATRDFNKRVRAFRLYMRRYQQELSQLIMKDYILP